MTNQLTVLEVPSLGDKACKILTGISGLLSRESLYTVIVSGILEFFHQEREFRFDDSGICHAVGGKFGEFGSESSQFVIDCLLAGLAHRRGKGDGEQHGIRLRGNPKTF